MPNRYQTILVTDPHSGETGEVSTARAAAFTGRSIATARRWAAGGRISRRDLALLRFHVLGVIDHPAWRRFRIRGDILECTSTGETWTPDQIESSWILFQQAAEYRRLMRRPRAPVLEMIRGHRPRWKAG